MDRAVIIRGVLIGRQRIELAEPITDVAGEVEVTVRPARRAADATGPDVFDVIAAFPRGGRSRAELDRQLFEERAAWVDR